MKKKKWFTVYYKGNGISGKIHCKAYEKPKELPFFLKGKFKITKVVRGMK